MTFLFKPVSLWKPIIAVIATAFAVLIVSYYAWENVTRFENEEVARTQYYMLLIAKSIGKNLEEFIYERKKDLEILTNIPSIQESFIMNKISDDAIDSIKLFTTIYRKDLTAIYLIKKDGNVLLRHPFWEDGIDRTGTSYMDREDVSYALQNHKPFLLDAWHVRLGKPYISFSLPVYQDRKFIGVVRDLIMLDTVSDRFLKSLKIGEKGYAQLLNEKGILLYHPVPEYIGNHIIEKRETLFKNFKWGELEKIVESMTKGEEGSGTYYSTWWTEKPKMTKKITAFAPVKIDNLSWSIGLTVDYSEINNVIIDHANKTFAFAGLLCFMFGAGGFIIHKIIKRKAHIETMVEKYNSMVNELNFGFFSSTLEGKMLMTNTVFSNMLGYESPEELMKSSASNLYIDLESANNFISELKDKNSVYNKKLNLRKKDGTTVAVTCTAQLKKKIITGYISELTTNDEENIITICANCSKIKEKDSVTDKWIKPADYFIAHMAEIKEPHLNYEFSHGICPACMQKIYGDYIK